MNIPAGCLLFFAGLLFGSFGNVISLRIHAHKTGILLGRSECPKCKHQLAWFENIPLFSWLFLRGKCSHCKKPISWQYPAAELLFGGVFALTGLFTPAAEPVLLLWRLVIIFALTVITLSDLRYMDVPDQVSLPTIRFLFMVSLISTYFFPLPAAIPTISAALTGAGALYLFFSVQILLPGILNSWREKSFLPLKNSILALIVLPVWLCFSVVFLHTWFERTITHGEGTQDEEYVGWVGGGDFRIAVIMGMALGPFTGLLAVFASYCIGALTSVPMLVLTSKTARSLIPLGPFLAFGTIIALLWGDQIVAAYLALLGVTY